MIIYKLEASDIYSGFMQPQVLEDDYYSWKFFRELFLLRKFQKYTVDPTIKFKHYHNEIILDKEPDYCYLLGNPIFSDKAIDTLGYILSDHIEYRILNNQDIINKKKYYVSLLSFTRDCIDFLKSDYDKEKYYGGHSPRIPNPIYPAPINKFELIESRINPHIDIFRMKLEKNGIFCNQNFVDNIIVNKLIGFKFIPIWSSDGVLGDVIQT